MRKGVPVLADDMGGTMRLACDSATASAPSDGCRLDEPDYPRATERRSDYSSGFRASGVLPACGDDTSSNHSIQAKPRARLRSRLGVRSHRPLPRDSLCRPRSLTFHFGKPSYEDVELDHYCELHADCGVSDEFHWGTLHRDDRKCHATSPARNAGRAHG